MAFEIRLATPDDNQAIEELIFRAFEGMELEGRTETREHYLAHLLRNDPAYIPELDWVLMEDQRLFAHIMYSQAKIIHADLSETEVIVFGPLSIDPDHQQRGIGRQLIAESIYRAQTLGYQAIVITGHPAYYQALGFVPASHYGITFMDGSQSDALLAYEIVAGALTNKAGKWKYADVFDFAETDDVGFNVYQQEFVKKMGN
ncbi:GNAT family N-acetyltransferase [Fundicoccus culcitae]|uniref:N-acetyltransferase n=1 Tax=Fundicoccus culcitae TaxID=2969821 RepID=A0ABY5P7E9_9LACT|nr:N-acetyltransferase [Fundicoccus culcitae]UUX34671.1 N-acetyltransferase [Fundicoccus culcitae]